MVGFYSLIYQVQEIRFWFLFQCVHEPARECDADTPSGLLQCILLFRGRQGYVATNMG